MRKVVLVTCLFIMLLSMLTTPVHATDITKNARSAILIEANGGKILYAKNEDERLYPASMTKMMSMLLILEAIHANKLQWDTMISASEHASGMGGSQIYLEPFEVMSVEDLFRSVAIASANDAVVALAEKIAVSEENFVVMMNEKAKSLGLKDTNFVNASGLHDPNHYSSAYDMAMIAKALLAVGGDELLTYTSTYDAYIREESDKKFWLVNTNKLIRQYRGTDGLKTGYTKESGYCITLTTQRNGLRLIGVVMKEPTGDIRNKEVAKMMDYGFTLYDTIPLYTKGQILAEIDIQNGKPGKANVYINEDVLQIVSKGKTDEQVQTEIEITKNTAPLMKDEVVGTVKIKMVDGIVIKKDLYIDRDIVPLTYFDILKRTWIRMLC